MVLLLGERSFKKRAEYRHQYEFRFLIKSEKEADFTLEIGSLEDIAEISKVEEATILFGTELEKK